MRCLYCGQRGITGLETAIVLIAFVVVSSVFAFAALSAGMFSSDKSREAHLLGLEQARASMVLKGAMQGTANTSGVTGVITEIRFTVSLAAGGQNVDLTPGTTMIMYTDDRQNKMFGSGPGADTYGSWFDTFMSEHLSDSGRIGVADAIMTQLSEFGQIEALETKDQKESDA